MRRLPETKPSSSGPGLWEILNNERGVALVLALLAVVLITALVLEFDFRTRLDMRGAANFRDDTQAYLLAQSAVKLARVLLTDEDKNRNVDYMDDAWAQAASFAGTPVGGGTVTLVIEDEDGKLNLNSLVKTDPGTGRQDTDIEKADIYYRLLEILEVEPDEARVMVDSVIDWIDTNDATVSADGAEGGHYETLEVPYRIRNGPLRTLDELLLVQGYDSKKLALISPYVTVIWEGEPPSASGPKPGLVNINTASRELLMALHPEMDENIAAAIYNISRGEEAEPFERADAQYIGNHVTTLGTNDTLKQALAKLIRPNSEHFSVLARGQVGDTVRTVRVTLGRPLIAKEDALPVLSWRVE